MRFADDAVGAAVSCSFSPSITFSFRHQHQRTGILPTGRRRTDASRGVGRLEVQRHECRCCWCCPCCCHGRLVLLLLLFYRCCASGCYCGCCLSLAIEDATLVGLVGVALVVLAVFPEAFCDDGDGGNDILARDEARSRCQENLAAQEDGLSRTVFVLSSCRFYTPIGRQHQSKRNRESQELRVPEIT